MIFYTNRTLKPIQAMELHRITSADDPLLEQLLPLYESAFPEEERRTRKQLSKMLSLTRPMYFNAILATPDDIKDFEALAEDTRALLVDTRILCGLFSYWDFDSFYYLEHLATFPQLRNHRIGGKVLTHMEQHFPQLQLLEVEPPTDEITRRRITYYERNGFRILNRDYLQPPYSRPSDENPGFPLWIMGRGTAGNIEENIRTIHQEVYIAPYSLDE